MKKLYTFHNWLLGLLLCGFLWIILLFYIVTASGCYTQKKALRQVAKAHNTYPQVPAKFCSELYPCKDSVSMVTEYLQGEDVVFTDTLTEVFHTIDTVTIVKWLTKTIKTTDTLRDVKYIQQTDKAKEKVLQADLDKLKTENTQLTDSRDNWRRYFLILAGVVLVYLAYRVIKWKFLKR